MDETKKLMAFFIGLVLFSAVLSGCTMNNSNDINNKSNINMANPASTFCINNGGKLDIRDAPDGQIGFCKFDNGKECEEWAFIRGECNANIASDNSVNGSTGTGKIGMANPASTFCINNGGKLEIKTANDGGQYGMCTFDNGKSCEEWAYMRGECSKEKKVCGECPQFMPAGPDFCKNGTIIPGIKDECGCVGTPKCESSLQIACTMDAKICPDGSAVGRIGPNCEFQACPSAEKPSGKKVLITCTADLRRNGVCTREYNPVCGWFNQTIKCIKYPCAIDASNPCTACSNPSVEYYTEGNCSSD